MGAIRKQENNVAEAQDLLQAALRIRRAKLGELHPETGIVMNNLAELLRWRGDLVGAKRLLEQALMTEEAELIGEHTGLAAR
jgi:Flp pilus assembly protein TadD